MTNMTTEFKRHDLVEHLKTGFLYIIVLGPEEGIVLEATNEPAYVYKSLFYKSALWVRSAKEMQDGRFVLRERTTHGAIVKTHSRVFISDLPY